VRKPVFRVFLIYRHLLELHLAWPEAGFSCSALLFSADASFAEESWFQTAGNVITVVPSIWIDFSWYSVTIGITYSFSPFAAS
jgi:hypothetical protein